MSMTLEYNVLLCCFFEDWTLEPLNQHWNDASQALLKWLFYSTGLPVIRQVKSAFQKCGPSQLIHDLSYMY